MSAITLTSHPPQLRPLNVVRDLGAVADLIEQCFHGGLDGDGRRFVQDMRQASRNDKFLRWATGAAETVSMPLSGYVWEQDGHVIGNVSLIPFRQKVGRIYLIANVAVHPDYRRRGIGRALTEIAMAHARGRDALSLWLHVREDNPGAVELYRDLGFVERLRRSTWQAAPDPRLAPVEGIALVARAGRYWPQQLEWLKRLHPPESDWYRSLNWDVFGPGLGQWLYRLFVDYDVRQWAALRDGRLQATLGWLPGRSYSDPLWVAFGPGSDPAALTALLAHARRTLTFRRGLSLELPAGESVDPVTAAGFSLHRTLLWMQAPGATN